MDSLFGFDTGTGKMSEKSCPMFGSESAFMSDLSLDSCSDPALIGPALPVLGETFPFKVSECMLPGFEGMMGMLPSMGMGIEEAEAALSTSEISEHLRECCDLRSACFKTCYMPERICTRAFKDCASKKCNSLMGTEKVVCEKDIQVFEITARLSDCIVYSLYQQDACRCYLSKEKAANARKEFVGAFYEVYNPGKDMSGMLKKVESSPTPARKFASLVNKLILKYHPDTIEHADDPKLEAINDQVNEQFGFASKVYDPISGDVVDKETGEKAEL